jgi:hypothetical protein
MKKEYVFAFKGATPKERFEEFAGNDGLLDQIANEAINLKKRDEGALIQFPVVIWFQYGKLMKAVHMLLCGDGVNLGTHFETFLALAISEGKFDLRDKLLALHKEILEGVTLYEDLAMIGVNDDEEVDIAMHGKVLLASYKYDYVYMRNRVRSFDACVTSVLGLVLV